MSALDRWLSTAPVELSKKEADALYAEACAEADEQAQKDKSR